MTNRDEYTDPVRRLLTIGKVGVLRDAWPDYPARFGLRREHIDDLIRMALDPALNAEEFGRDVWAPVHASRALGQLQAVEAVVPLLLHLKDIDADDLAAAELIETIAAIGPAAIPRLDAFIAAGDGDGGDDFEVGTAIEALAEIGKASAECRDHCISILTRRLGDRERIDPTINGFAVSALLDLAAVEALDAIRDAFHGDVVDVSIAGDLEDVEIELGVREARATPKPRYLEQMLRLRRDFDAAPPVRVASEPRVAAPYGPAKSVKIGRNERCPCGSGKKFKKCCGDGSKKDGAAQ